MFSRTSLRALASMSAALLIVWIAAGQLMAASTIGNNFSTDGTLSVNGNSTLGDAATDTITFTGQLSSAITFVKEVARTIQIADSETANTAGAALTIKGALGLGTGNGGALNVTGGTGGTSNLAVGGAVNLTGGTAGATSTNTIATGGGAVVIAGGTASATGTGISVGGDVTIAGGAGSGGLLSNGGATTITTGAGGTATSTTSGVLTLSTGTGGSSSGASGAININSGTTTSGGTGIVTLKSGNATGAASGAVSIATGTSSGAGFASGNITVQPGIPGDGNGGSVNITGATAVGTNRSGGAVNIISGTATGSGAGGGVTITAGGAGASADQATDAGIVLISGGQGFASDIQGGAVTIAAGAGGTGGASGNGGVASLSGGAGGARASAGVGTTGGGVTVQGGLGGISPSDANASGNGGTATLAGGSGMAGSIAGNGVGGAGGATTVRGGDGAAGTGSGAGGAGGALTIRGGNAAGSGNSNGGTITIQGGNATGNGTQGSVSFDGGTTDRTADLVTLDVDVNSANVDGIFIDGDVGTALSSAETFNGINLDMAGIGGDDAASFINGITLVGDLTTAGTIRGLNVTTGFDVGIAGSTVNATNASADFLDYTGTTGVMDGSDVFQVMDINLTSAAHASTNTIAALDIDITGANSAGADTIRAIDISMASPDAEAVETGILVGTGWDTGLAITTVNQTNRDADAIDFTGTVATMDGSETFQVMDINLTSANHTGSNTITGIDLALTSPDAEATETAIIVGANWDVGISSTTVNQTNASADAFDYTGTTGVMDGSDVFQVMDINLTSAAHASTNTIAGIDIDITSANSAGADTIRALDVSLASPDTEAVETGIFVGTGWDTGIAVTTVNQTNASADAFDFTGTTATMDGSDVFQVFDINLTSAAHASTNTIAAMDIDITGANSGGADTIRAIDISMASPDVEAVETGILVGTGWDTGIAITTVNQSNANADAIDFTGTVATMDGSDVFQVIDINLTSANHTGSNTITGIDLALASPDAEATETALIAGANWDRLINMADLNQTNGTLVNLDYATTTLATAATTLVNLNANTDVTGGSAVNFTGVDVQTPTLSSTASTTYTGYDISGSGTLTHNTAGTLAWRGHNVELPAITQTGATLRASGYRVDTEGTITTGGTKVGVDIVLSDFANGTGNGVAITPPATTGGTTNGILINSITTSTGTDTAISVGTTWDNILDGTTAGTDLINFDNLEVSSAGAMKATLSTSVTEDSVMCLDLDQEGTMDLFAAEGDATCDASSIKVKDNVSELQSGLDLVLKLRPVYFKYKEDFKPFFQEMRMGFIAEEMNELIPEVTTWSSYDENGLRNGDPDGIDYEKLTAVLAKAIQEQQQQITALSMQLQPAAGADVLKTVTLDKLTVAKAATFQGKITVKGLARFDDQISVGSDTAGVVKVAAGQKTLKVEFSKSYKYGAPVVTLTPLANVAGNYWLSDVSAAGFTVNISRAQSSDVSFNWIALGVTSSQAPYEEAKNAQTAAAGVAQ